MYKNSFGQHKNLLKTIPGHSFGKTQMSFNMSMKYCKWRLFHYVWFFIIIWIIEKTRWIMKSLIMIKWVWTSYLKFYFLLKTMKGMHLVLVHLSHLYFCHKFMGCYWEKTMTHKIYRVSQKLFFEKSQKSGFLGPLCTNCKIFNNAWEIGGDGLIF